MSVRFYDIVLPVVVREDGHEVDARPMTVTIMMGSDATPKDAVEELARRIQERCDTMGMGDEE